MIEFVSGDILQTTASHLAQGVAVGSQEGLGTGLAMKISTKWPEAQKAFKKFTFNNKFEGGDLFVVEASAERPGIIYVATQPDMYHAVMPFLNKGLRRLVRYCEQRGIESVAVPKIGAGLGKLDWQSEVRPLMISHFEPSPTRFLVYEDFRNEFE